MRKCIALLLAAIMIVILAGCSIYPTGKTTLDKSELKVGAIYINSREDTAGYTFAHHSGIVSAMNSLGMDAAS